MLLLQKDTVQLKKSDTTNKRLSQQIGLIKSKANIGHPKSAKSNDYTLFFNNFNSTNRKEIKLSSYAGTTNHQKPISQNKPKTAKNPHKVMKVNLEDSKVSNTSKCL